MNWKQFVAAIVKATAWPFVVVWAVVLLKEPLDRAIGNAEKLTYGSVEISFSQKIDQIKQYTEQSAPGIQKDQNKRKKLTIIATLSPSTAVVKSWDEVVVETSKLMLKLVPELVLDSERPYMHLEDLLIEYGIVNSKQIKVFHDLRVLRNKIVYAPQYGITPEQAIEYADLALSLAEYMNSL